MNSAKKVTSRVKGNMNSIERAKRESRVGNTTSFANGEYEVIEHNGEMTISPTRSRFSAEEQQAALERQVQEGERKLAELRAQLETAPRRGEATTTEVVV